MNTVMLAAAPGVNSAAHTLPVNVLPVTVPVPLNTDQVQPTSVSLPSGEVADLSLIHI